MNKMWIVCAMVIALTGTAHAAFSTADGYVSTELYSSLGSYELIGGLALDGDTLYFGQNTDILSLGLPGGPTTLAGTVAGNVGVALVLRSEGVTYTAYGTSTASPYPHEMGYIQSDGMFFSQTSLNGVYDAAVSPAGDCYVVAKDEIAGSQILQYDWNTGGTTLVADIGGYSGGLTFDAAGNLYYADQGDYGVRDASVLKFSAAQVATGGLTAADGQSVLDVTGGYLGFDDEGGFYATTGWGAALSKYDLATGQKVHDVAFSGIGQFVWDEAMLYALSTDYNTWSTTVQAITVPEPASMVLLAAGAAGLLVRRRRS